MKNILLIVIFTVTIGRSNAQSIVAGQYGQWDYYYDYSPDSLMYEPSTWGIVLLPVDLNGDGMNDVTLHVFYEMPNNWGHETSCWIEPGANSQVAFLETDSCYTGDSIPILATIDGFAQGFIYGSMIDASATWVDSTLFFTKEKARVNQPTGTYAGYNCSHQTIGNTPAFLGVRIFTPDTLYGWIQMSVTLNTQFRKDTIHLYSYACQTSLVGIQDASANNNSGRITPNPSNGIFTSSEFFASGTIEVRDELGRIVYQRELCNERPVVDLSAEPVGIYFIMTTNGKTQNVQRVVIYR